VGSLFIHDAKLTTTVGGVVLANWGGEQTSAVGVKELATGARTTHFGGFAHTSGADAGMLFRNLIGWAHGGLPSPKVPDFTHTWGDNGVYTVDVSLIDDDMGYVWDVAGNRPTQVLPNAVLAHKFVTVTVNSVDPTIDRSSIQAFIATQVCVRVSGSGGNTVTLNVYSDGVLAATTSATRDGGSPNPTTEKCGLFKVDVLAPHTLSAKLTYAAPMGGSNPTWLIFQPWRDPVNPGHGTVTVKVDLASPGTQAVDVSGLKQALLDSGQGARIDFSAQAGDVGSDDLAFLWVWGATGATPYVTPTTPSSDYAIDVHCNAGGTTVTGVLAGPQFLGYCEPYFNRAANTGRSPLGPTGVHVQDSAVHAFDPAQTMYYVVLIVLDDDNSRGYASHFAPTDGVDMQFVLVNLA